MIDRIKDDKDGFIGSKQANLEMEKREAETPKLVVVVDVTAKTHIGAGPVVYLSSDN